MSGHPSAAQRILMALAKAPRPVCDDCLPQSAELSSRQQANAECRRLERLGTVRRRLGSCGVCGADKLVNQAAVGSEGSEGDAGATGTRRTTGPGDRSSNSESDDGLDGRRIWEVQGYPFRLIGPIQPTCEPSGAVRLEYPHLRYGKAATSTLNRYGAGPFCRFSIPKELTHTGVYLLADRSEIRYVGKCDNLAVRFNMGYGQIAPRNCYLGGQNTNCKVNGLILAEILLGQQLDLWFYETEIPLDVEKRLIAELQPPWNGRL